jgi:DNA modification methylase
MSSEIKSDYYPISLEEIKRSASKRNRRTNSNKLISDFAEIEGLGYPNVKEQINKYGEKIVRVDGEIPYNLPVKNGQRFLFISYDQSTLTHGLHKYPAKFFPELPRWLILRYSAKHDTILDPFSGSGTTNVEAQLHERHSIGIDVDPFSRFLAKVKTTPLEKNDLDWSCETLLNELIEYHPDLISIENIPEFPYRDNWFRREIIFELTYIKNVIESLDIDYNMKNFYLICFSSIIRTVSNADNNCTRTVIRKKLNKKVFPSDALTKFAEKVLVNIPKMNEYSTYCPRGINVIFPEDCDARDIRFPDDYFDLSVTSPPYANAVDYPRTHQLELYWLGLKKGSLVSLKRQHVGTESVRIEEYKDYQEIGIKEADSTIKRIHRKDPRRAYIGFNYLRDMKKNLMEVYRVLKKDGRYVVVVGNNKIRGELFESWKYIIKIAKSIGFGLENYCASEIIRHFIKVPREERIDTDWIIILRK